MNKEIKEILDSWKLGIDKNGIYVGGLCYSWEQLSLLLDYITNLQQEKDTYKEQLRITHKDLEHYISRCEKAVEYIKEHIRIDDEYPAYMEMLIEERDDLLNILQNGSENND